MNYYGDDVDYIHLKFGQMRKCYNFTEEFRQKHPRFCEEYEKYWNDEKNRQFEHPMQIANYVKMWDIPVHFYFNYTDTPAKSIEEVQMYLVRETLPQNFCKYEDGKSIGWDGEEESKTEGKIVLARDGNAVYFDNVEGLFSYVNKLREKKDAKSIS